MKIDLHIHTTNSDGTDSVQEIIERAIRESVDIIAFTDHDSVGAYHDLAHVTVPHGTVTVVKAVELSCSFNGDKRDMLGYGIDENVVEKFLVQSKRNIIKIQTTIMHKFAQIVRKEGMIVDDDLELGAFPEGYLAVWQSLVRHPENLKRFPFIQQPSYFYWNYFANPKSPFYVDATGGLPTMAEAINVIHRAGGLAFLAHPFGYAYDDAQMDDFLKSAVKFGIDGVEIMNSIHAPDHVGRLERFARDNNLFTSGGTDYHGTHKKNVEFLTGCNGNVEVTAEHIAPWIDRVAKITVGAK